MARVVDELPMTRPASKWEKFLDGQAWELVEGEDFSNLAAARSALLAKAKRMGGRASTRNLNGKLYVQYLPPT